MWPTIERHLAWGTAVVPTGKFGPDKLPLYEGLRPPSGRAMTLNYNGRWRGALAFGLQLLAQIKNGGAARGKTSGAKTRRLTNTRADLILRAMNKYLW